MDDGRTLEADIGRLLDAGDLDGAATAALRGYGPEIASYLKLLLHSEESAYEVFAQFGEDLWKGIGGFRREATLRAWAYRLAFHAAMRFGRESARRRERRLETTEMSKIVADVRSSIMGHPPGEVHDRLARIREQLEPEEQTLLTLRIDRDFSWSEVAEVLSEVGGPVGEPLLRKRFQRLRQKLRDLARQEGL